MQHGRLVVGRIPDGQRNTHTSSTCGTMSALPAQGHDGRGQPESWSKDSAPRHAPMPQQSPSPVWSSPPVRWLQRAPPLQIRTGPTLFPVNRLSSRRAHPRRRLRLHQTARHPCRKSRIPFTAKAKAHWVLCEIFGTRSATARWPRRMGTPSHRRRAPAPRRHCRPDTYRSTLRGLKLLQRQRDPTPAAHLCPPATIR